MSEKLKVVFQGEPGANSHLAALEVYPDCEAIACPTFEDCFAALASGVGHLGMIPIENSTAGRVADIHLAARRCPYHRRAFPAGSPPASRRPGRTAREHQDGAEPRAGARAVPADAALARHHADVGADTAGSAREIAEGGDPTRAAIACCSLPRSTVSRC